MISFNNTQNSLCVLGDDAQEEEGENPFANLINNPENEKLYIDDPKKALKGYFEREGTLSFFYKKRGNIKHSRNIFQVTFCYGLASVIVRRPMSVVRYHLLLKNYLASLDQILSVEFLG